MTKAAEAAVEAGAAGAEELSASASKELVRAVASDAAAEALAELAARHEGKRSRAPPPVLGEHVKAMMGQPFVTAAETAHAEALEAAAEDDAAAAAALLASAERAAAGPAFDWAAGTLLAPECALFSQPPLDMNATVVEPLQWKLARPTFCFPRARQSEVPPHADYGEGRIWTLESSIFAARLNESQAQSYWDTPVQCAEALTNDWRGVQASVARATRAERQRSPPLGACACVLRL